MTMIVDQMNQSKSAKKPETETAKKEPAKNIPKFKSAMDSAVQGVDSSKVWKQPLKRHINYNTGKVEFVTILVRILNGEAGISD